MASVTWPIYIRGHGKGVRTNIQSYSEAYECWYFRAKGATIVHSIEQQYTECKVANKDSCYPEDPGNG